MAALRAELDQKYETTTGLTNTASKVANPTNLSSKSRTSPPYCTTDMQNVGMIPCFCHIANSYPSPKSAKNSEAGSTPETISFSRARVQAT